MFDVAIIGAGPAGMSAALTAADHGLTVVVIDEQQRAGGQIFRQPPEAFTGSVLHPTAGYGWATELIRRFEEDPRLTTEFGWSAIGVLHDDEEPGDLRVAMRVAINHPEHGTRMIGARRLLIATGAYDLPVAFPGWTLPGVMTAGGVQTLVKSQRIAPVGDVVLAGAHPLLLLVADLLVRNGVPVREVAFAQSLPTPTEMLLALGAVPGHLRMLAETGAILARLVRKGVRVSPRTIVTAAHGTEHVSGVELARVDRQWRVTGAPREVAASHLVLGYGFSASTELARQIGCELAFDSPRGGWVVAHDERRQTSVPGVFVAGEPTGVAGADRSCAEGALAGLGIAADLGRPVPPAAFAEAERTIRKATRFSTVVQRVFEPVREALGDLAKPETTICRCEMVTRGTIDDFLESSPFVSNINAIKLSCRTGMGPCQGRYCESSVGTVLASAREQPIGLGGRFSAHLPIKPVPVGDLRGLDSAAE
ncbi:NAD(P)/FAD-dependent oxidoreductase [Streptomyces sp. NPDC001876]|uniref:NAD(P)/FAD-dependent oxidoreductase n=1 Tax=Streptomyces sp. NPDC001876 TaxID=3154402 RepID=UPI0033289BCF